LRRKILPAEIIRPCRIEAFSWKILTRSIYKSLGAQFKDVKVIDPIDLFCTTSECRPNTGKTILFSDTNHLSPAGIEIFYEKYRNDFEWVFTGGAEMKDDEGRRNQVLVEPGGVEPPTS
jgi:hypothetical protein